VALTEQQYSLLFWYASACKR